MSTLTAAAIAPRRSGRSRDILGRWGEGVIYQVRVRSFQNADGDGIGDLEGVWARSHSVGSFLLEDAI